MNLQYYTLEDPLIMSNYILWIIAVLVSYFVTIYSLLKYVLKRDELEKLQKENIITWMLFFLALSITNTLNIIWRFLIIDEDLAAQIDAVSIIISIFAWTIKIFNIERGINRSNLYKGYYFTILSVIFLVTTIVLNPYFIREFGPIQVIMIVLFFVAQSLLPGIFVYLAAKSSGKKRTECIWICVGLIAILLGMMFQPQNIIPYINLWPSYEILTILAIIFTPVLIILGIFLIFINHVRSF